MKRRGALRVHERLKNMTVEQQIEYWRRRSEEFLRKQHGHEHAKNRRTIDPKQ